MTMTPSAYIRAKRLEIDTIINSFRYLVLSHEVTKAHDAARLGKMWLGQVLKELNEPNPYPESTNPDSGKIEPQAEHTEDSYKLRFERLIAETHEKFNQGGDFIDAQTVCVKFLRGTIDAVIDPIQKDVDAQVLDLDTGTQKKFFEQSILCLMESKMWLGMELDRIRTASADNPFPKTASKS